MSNDPKKVLLGPCTVTFDSTDLGFTKGGVEVSITTPKKTIDVDQFGDSEIDERIMGRMVTVRCPLAEHDLSVLAKSIPGSTLITDGTDATKMRLELNSAYGTSLREIAAELVLHPKHKPVGEKNEDFVIPLAAPGGDIEFSFHKNDERIYSIEFKAFTDVDTGLVAYFGDDSATA